MKTKEWHFFDRVYRRWVVVLIGPREGLTKELKLNGWTDEDCSWSGGAAGVHIKLDESNSSLDNRCHIVWMPKLDLGTLVHELGHLVLSIFDTCGVVADANNQEVLTFYQEFWFSEITTTIKRYPKGLPHTKVKI